MTDDDKKCLMLLRLFLVGAGIAWGVSVFGLVLPWEIVNGELVKLGAESIDDSMVIYWLKMAAAAYTLIGCFFVAVAIWPAKFRTVIGPIGWMHTILGAILLVNGLLLGIGAIPLYVDSIFCICVGVGILIINCKLDKCAFKN